MLAGRICGPWWDAVGDSQLAAAHANTPSIKALDRVFIFETESRSIPIAAAAGKR
jgi:hypothetical protein